MDYIVIVYIRIKNCKSLHNLWVGQASFRKYKFVVGSLKWGLHITRCPIAEPCRYLLTTILMVWMQSLWHTFAILGSPATVNWHFIPKCIRRLIKRIRVLATWKGGLKNLTASFYVSSLRLIADLALVIWSPMSPIM